MKVTKSMIERAKRSLAGRAVCKLAGDRTGAVMMEYVIVAVLIAAACVVAVSMFGKTITQMFGSAAKGASGDSKESVQMREKAQDSSKAAVSDGTSHANKYSDTAAAEGVGN